MYEDGFENITNIDISECVTKIMEERCRSDFPNMTCKYYNNNNIVKQMDVRNMTDFDSNCFTVVLDKGTFDVVLCDYDPHKNVEMMLSEIYRVLAPGGVYVCISNASEEQRMKFFVNYKLIFIYLG
jgi:ubiquinone/menaquinone biosynthesis C-methylase UbiE